MEEGKQINQRPQFPVFISMASTVYFLALLFLLMLVGTGMCQCPNNNVKIEEVGTGRSVGGKAEWKVTLSTDCICVQTDVKLGCGGFQSVESLDASVITQDGDTCSLVNPVNSDSPTTFTYAWDTSFGFKLISSSAACS